MTVIEAAFVAQGYELPAGWTWERVDQVRERYDIRAYLVPLVCAGGVVAWGVPMAGGKALLWRRPEDSCRNCGHARSEHRPACQDGGGCGHQCPCRRFVE
jgi:hypothetical protein